MFNIIDNYNHFYILESTILQKSCILLIFIIFYDKKIPKLAVILSKKIIICYNYTDKFLGDKV